MPHTSFNLHGKIVAIDLEMEKFQNNYDGFIQHVKGIISKMNSDEAKNKFIEELKVNKHLNLFITKLYNKKIDQFFNDILM